MGNFFKKSLRKFHFQFFLAPFLASNEQLEKKILLGLKIFLLGCPGFSGVLQFFFSVSTIRHFPLTPDHFYDGFEPFFERF